MSKYELIESIKAHSTDVKCLGASKRDAAALHAAPEENEEELLVTASRDLTSCLLTRSSPSSPFRNETSYSGSSRYLNACEYLPDSEYGPAQVIVGGLDSLITVYAEHRGDKPLQVLNEHYDNVCALDIWLPLPVEQQSRAGKESASIVKSLLASASWDCTARVYEYGSAEDEEGNASLEEQVQHDPRVAKWRPRRVLRGHERAVWGVKIVDHERVLTTSADLFIRLFKDEELIKIYSGHTDVVRGIELLPPRRSPSAAALEGDAPFLSPGSSASTPSFFPNEHLFATTSNDLTVRVWSLDDRRSPPSVPSNGGEALRVLKGHRSLVYDVAALGDDRLVSCGEDGSARIWNIDDGSLLHTIWHNVATVWSVTILPISHDIATGSADGAVRIFRSRENTSTRLESSQRDEEEHEAFQKAAEEMQQQMEKAVTAEVTLVDDDQPRQITSADGLPEEGEGATVLQIDVADDREPLPLRVKHSDDPLQRAKEFVQEQSLPESYTDRIAEFIKVMLH